MENRQMFMEMIGQDTPNDRKSLSWDGTALTVVDDPLDDASLLDGRGGEYAAARLRTPLLRVIVREESGLLRDGSILQNDETAFWSETEERLFCAVCLPDSWEDTGAAQASRLEAGEAAPAKNAIEGALCEEGFVQTQANGVMIGVTVYVQTQTHGVVRLVYAGKGNLSDIREEAGSVFAKAVSSLK